MGCRNGHSSQEIKYSFTVVIKEMKIEVHFFYMMDHFDALKKWNYENYRLTYASIKMSFLVK